MTNPETHGGKRKGAGRPPIIEGGRTRTIYCSDSELAEIKRLLAKIRQTKKRGPALGGALSD